MLSDDEKMQLGRDLFDASQPTEEPSWKARAEKAEARVAELEHQLKRAIQGGALQPCDDPACNCDGYHSRYASRMLEESERAEQAEAEVEEAKAAVPSWCDGPGLVGAVLHMAERVEQLEDAVEMARADANAVPMGGAELMHELGQERVARKKVEAEVERCKRHADRVEGELGVALLHIERVVQAHNPAGLEVAIPDARGGEKLCDALSGLEEAWEKLR